MTAKSVMKIKDMQALIGTDPFGLLVSSVASDLAATHLPLIFERDDGIKGSLYGHFARATPHWRQLDGEEVLVVFNSPHAYISPRWYDTTPNVPTWNYAAVQVKGRLQLLDDRQTLEVMEKTFAQFEPSLLVDNDISTPEYRQRLLAGIVAFKIEIINWQGKQKLGQQRSLADQQGVVKGLQASNTPESQCLLQYMQTTKLGLGETV
ncbi:FMN-binding negative transcriptional regulator [Shewanella surugensis]|uniref:FMN-binding negative transcriptional regulator n=1 Tax=Shewanella surugensis TaxID=212020 RepID=A0ABT0LIR1_9GAMM|nr:FMN-binding negative transcriptional regulator [Shewanella surugensis]MCL1127594.1 FMN-binding negative transcriptional regulator [Shewanella surugensis]